VVVVESASAPHTYETSAFPEPTFVTLALVMVVLDAVEVVTFSATNGVVPSTPEKTMQWASQLLEVMVAVMLPESEPVATL
jgi:hypothetical protein